MRRSEAEGRFGAFPVSFRKSASTQQCDLFLKANAVTIDISVSGFARDAKNGVVRSLSETAKTNLVEKKNHFSTIDFRSVEWAFGKESRSPV